MMTPDELGRAGRHLAAIVVALLAGMLLDHACWVASAPPMP